eukprot:5622361-Pleurochrysis_carterae.AAC.1
MHGVQQRRAEQARRARARTTMQLAERVARKRVTYKKEHKALNRTKKTLREDTKGVLSKGKTTDRLHR